MPRPLSTSLLFASAVLVSLALVELGLRAAVDVPYRPPPEPLAPESWRELLHRPSSVPGLAYELRPGAEKTAMGVPVRINSLGMRDDEPLAGEDVLRVAALGDSYTFGFGVHAEQAWPHRLEQLLDRGGRARHDVLNLGVGGYSTRDEALVLEHKALPLHPRVVVLAYYLNDPETDPIQPLHRAFHGAAWWQHSALLRSIAMQANAFERRRYGDGDYHRYLHFQPEKWGSVVAGFERMAALVGAAGIPLLVAIFPRTPAASGWSDYRYTDLHARVAAEAERNGLRVVDLLEVFAQHDPARLRLGRHDRHPTPFGHALAAQALYAPVRELLGESAAPAERS